MNIGVIGWGSVGNAAVLGMSPHNEVVAYDSDGRGQWRDILQTELTLVCVNTDASENDRLDMSNIEDVVHRLNGDGYEGVVVIKSTLHPGTMDSLVNQHPRLKLVYMPEFLREKDAVEWFADPDRIVISGEDDDIDIALRSFIWVKKEVPRIHMTHLEAELGKLAHNAFIATKVTFTCEIERIARMLGADPYPVMNTVWSDRRVLNQAHLTPGLGGYNGKCVPKDTNALAMMDTDPNSMLKILEKRGGEDAFEKRMNFELVLELGR